MNGLSFTAHPYAPSSGVDFGACITKGFVAIALFKLILEKLPGRLGSTFGLGDEAPQALGDADDHCGLLSFAAGPAKAHPEIVDIVLAELRGEAGHGLAKTETIRALVGRQGRVKAY